MKAIILATLLLATNAAFAADLSSVGTSNIEATADYSYTRARNTPDYLATHEALVGVQANLGDLGSVSLEAGDTQRVTSTRVNTPTLAVGYANGFHVGKLGVVGGLVYSDQVGDKWLPWIHGNTSSLPINNIAGTVEVNFPVSFVVSHYFVQVKPFVDYTYGYTWTGDIDSTHTYAEVTAVHTSTAAVGAYADLSKHVVAKIGYDRSFGTAGPNTQGVLTSLNYKF